MSVVRRDDGHAVVEAITLGLILLVPIIWMLSVFAEMHAAAIGASSAAREAGFEAARSATAVVADRRVSDVVAQSMIDHGLDAKRARVQWVPAPGWRRGAAIEVEVTYVVPAVQIPLLGELPEPTISVTGRHLAVIDRYRSRG